MTENRAPSDKYFNDLIYIMSNTKSKTGSGTPIVVHFFAKINEDSKIPGHFEAEYDYDQFEDDLTLIKPKQPKYDEHRYCLKQVYKMCFYI